MVWRGHASLTPGRAGHMPHLNARGRGNCPWLDTSQQQLYTGRESHGLWRTASLVCHTRGWSGERGGRHLPFSSSSEFHFKKSSNFSIGFDLQILLVSQPSPVPCDREPGCWCGSLPPCTLVSSRSISGPLTSLLLKAPCREPV